MPHFRNELNTLAARRGLRVTYEDGFEGPQHDCIWRAIVYVDGVEYGRGQASDRGGAREAAAKQAVDALNES